jgi:sRNA-binding carbon storage regulator CsrA
MVFFTRRRRESVVVGDGVQRLLKVTVLEIGNDSVLLGFETGADAQVDRWTVWDVFEPALCLRASNRSPASRCDA